MGLWNSEKGAAVDIRDILWPGEALKPPEGVPERGFLSVTFLEVEQLTIDNLTRCCLSRRTRTSCWTSPQPAQPPRAASVRWWLTLS